MKRRLFVILTSMLLLLLFTGCGAQNYKLTINDDDSSTFYVKLAVDTTTYNLLSSYGINTSELNKQKELNKKLKKLERRVADCEAEIEQTESAISILETKMATPEGASDMALYEQHQKLKAQLDNVMEEWDAASSELEEARK